MKQNSAKAQGALEYLLLIGGAVLIAAVVISLLAVTGSLGGATSHNASNAYGEAFHELETITGGMGGTTPPAETCDDGVKNQNESDIDCGGDCSDCGIDDHCNSNADCSSGYCDPGLSTCQTLPACEDDCTAPTDGVCHAECDRIGLCVLIDPNADGKTPPTCLNDSTVLEDCLTVIPCGEYQVCVDGACQDLLPPATLTVTVPAVEKQLDLSWSSVGNADSYTIGFYEDGDLDYTLISGVQGTSYSHTGIDCDRKYYSIKACKGTVCSNWGTELGRIPRINQQPAPASLNATGKLAAVFLTWPLVVGSVYDVEYVLYKKSGVSWGFLSLQPPESTSFSSSGLVEDTPYYFKINSKSCGTTFTATTYSPVAFPNRCGDTICLGNLGENCSNCSDCVGGKSYGESCEDNCECSSGDCINKKCSDCGNGIKEYNEECDVGDVGGKTCAALGCSGTIPTCNPDCTLNKDSCSNCVAPPASPHCRNLNTCPGEITTVTSSANYTKTDFTWGTPAVRDGDFGPLSFPVAGYKIYWKETTTLPVDLSGFSSYTVFNSLSGPHYITIGNLNYGKTYYFFIAAFDSRGTAFESPLSTVNYFGSFITKTPT